MICAISGTTPEEPVVSTKSGHVYERRLIEKYVDANGKDPVTNEPLETKDLIPLKVNKSVKPRPVTATSIPSMLQLFQNEWDAMMLETYTLKQHLETVRQELAHALYQHDAACRVIARLIKERDTARSTLSSLSAQLPEGGRAQPREASSSEAMEVDGAAATGMSDAVAKKLEEKSKSLSKDRKKRQQSASLASADAVKDYKVVSSNNTHKASAPGVLCLDIHPQQELIVTGGVDTTAIVFNRETGKITGTLNGHSKRVNDVLFNHNGDLIVTASQDKTARVWRAANGGYSQAHVVKTHTDDVTGISLHATGDYFATSSLDCSWGFHDINTGSCLLKVQRTQAGLSSIAFHPDGLILGTGTADSVVRIWDVKSQENAATFEGHTGRIVDLSFSENGFYLATAAEDSIKLWDLRKLSNFYTIPIEGSISAVNFDYSGNYLAAAGSYVSIYTSGKTFSPVQVYKDHSAAVTDVKFGRDASFFASTSMDRSLKIYSSAK